MASDDEAALLRALADPDPTVQRMAAVRAHKVSLPSVARILAALEALLAHEDKYLRRAAAASYVAMHPRGPAAPALRPLLQDPAQIVALTARGSLLDAGHELAELAFVVRTLAYATRADTGGFATTVARWHRFLWLYSPNAHAATVMKSMRDDELEREADHVRDAVIGLLCARAVPREVTQVRMELDGTELAARGSTHGQHAWSARTRAHLPALRRLADLAWDVDDAPWRTVFAAGSFALAVARAIDAAPAACLADVAEREITTSVGGDTEEIFLGFLGPAGISYAE